MELPLCTEAIYSNDYFNYIIRTESSLNSADIISGFACANMVNEGLGVGYRRLPSSEDYVMTGAFYESVPKCYGLMDVSAIEATGADRLYTLPGINVSGKGVLIGFIDTGIDYRNKVFNGINGTRIEYIWDQTIEAYGSAPDYYGFGAEYDKAMIDRAIVSENPYDIVPSTDDIGHGTFLASVAAGAKDYAEEFRGMAFESGIIMVKLKNAKQNLRDFYYIKDDVPCYGEDDILLGVRYLIDKAKELKRPLVICLGVGSSQGNHTGDSALELYLYSFVNTKDLCVVAAVGNELGEGGHYRGDEEDADDDGYDRVEIGVSGNCKGFFVEFWGKAPGLLKTAILSPTGERYDKIPYLEDKSAKIRFLYEGTMVNVTNIAIDDVTGDQLILFRFDNPTEGIWTIEVSGRDGIIETGFDAWLPIREFLDTDVRFIKSEPEVTICAPANGRGAISVSGYDHEKKSLFFKAGRGYTRNGFIKPDLTAPAVMVKGAFATKTGKSLYTNMSGTSVAAAITAGAAALIMDWVKGLGGYSGISTEIIRQLFIRGAEQINELPYPNTRWGYGILDLLKTFERLRT